MLNTNNRGLVSRAQAIRTDATDNELKRAVKDRELDRTWRGQYLTTAPLTNTPDNAYAETLERYRFKVMAAARVGTGDRVVGFSSAATLLGVPLLSPDLDVVHFTTATGTGRTAGKAIIHQAPIDPIDVIEFSGVRLTGIARTVADTARIGTFEQAITVLDQGLRRGATLDDLERIVASQKRWRGIELLRRSLPLATPQAESVGESYSRALIYRFDDIPDPTTQFKVLINDGTATAWSDFGWEGKVVGEFDGHVKYTRNRAFRPGKVEDVVYEEKLREDAIRELGIWVIRWTWDDLRNPVEFHRKLVEGLTRAGIL